MSIFRKIPHQSWEERASAFAPQAIACGAQLMVALAKTVRTCRQLLKVEEALWLFTEVPGVELGLKQETK